MKIESDFQEFLSNIEPAKTHVDDAKTGHETLRARLEKDEDYGQKLSGGTFLSGSYRRRTAVKPVKDVDVIVPLTFNPNLTARECLEDLRTTLKKYYKAPNLENQRRSIRVDLSYVTLDIVPGLVPSGPDGVLKVPDREQSTWLDSNPKGHIQWTQDLNRTSGGIYIPTVKAFKWWRRYRLGEAKHPKSFFLERMVADEIGIKADSMAELIYQILKAMRTRYELDVSAGRVPVFIDPGLPGQTLKTGMTPVQFRDFHIEVSNAEKWALLALRAPDESRRVEALRKLFGPEFSPSETRARGSLKVARPRDAGEEFLEDYGIHEQLQYDLQLNAHVVQNGFRQFKLRGSDFPLRKKRTLEFYIERCTVPEPFVVKWKVKNVGEEAVKANDLRGQIVIDSGHRIRSENTKYTGAHYIECYAIQDGVCVAKARLNVPIANIE